MSKQALMAAAVAKLKAESIESYAVVDVMLNNPSGVSEHVNYVEEIVSHAKNIYVCESAARKIQEVWGRDPSQSPIAKGAKARPRKPRAAAVKTEISDVSDE